jgi:hypothetical protein
VDIRRGGLSVYGLLTDPHEDPYILDVTGGSSALSVILCYGDAMASSGRWASVRSSFRTENWAREVEWFFEEEYSRRTGLGLSFDQWSRTEVELEYEGTKFSVGGLSYRDFVAVSLGGHELVGSGSVVAFLVSRWQQLLRLSRPEMPGIFTP